MASPRRDSTIALGVLAAVLLAALTSGEACASILAAASAATGDLTVAKPLGSGDNPVYIHDVDVARYTWWLFLATLGLAALALFQDRIREWWQRPLLIVSIQTAQPDCAMVPIGTIKPDEATPTFVPALHVGMWVENVGRGSADDVEVFASALRKLRKDGQWEEIRTFPPMNLVWANFGTTRLGIPVGSRRRVAVAHVSDPAYRKRLDHHFVPDLEANSVAFHFYTQHTPNSYGNIVAWGDYQVDLEISARNYPTHKCTLRLNASGKWHADENKMLSEGISATIEDSKGLKPIASRRKQDARGK